MGNAERLATVAIVVGILVILCAFLPTNMEDIMPEVEVTLANDGMYPIWYMCQLTDKSASLYELEPNSTYRFKFPHLAFPMRWCYLYINPRSHGFFWAYTVRSRCTKCFWSINKHPALYRGDKGRWERQKLFMPADFNLSKYQVILGEDKPDNPNLQEKRE